jgi:hypothetical protein
MYVSRANTKGNLLKLSEKHYRDETRYSVSYFALCHWDGKPNELALSSIRSHQSNGPPSF